jgi:prepilin-type N-terminal cleavage/methylation domain-containing protein
MNQRSEAALTLVDSHRRIESRRADSRRAGMTLVEVMVATVVLTISVYLLSSTITATVGLTSAKREMATAMVATRSQLEYMRGREFREVFALFNHDPDDDPGGPGTAPGPHFAVEGLRPRPGDADGMVGEVILPAQGSVLLENGDNPALDMPRDLNGDLHVDAADHASDYLVLPVQVRLEWTGRSGERRFERFTMLAALEKLGDAP